jgi:hypothetical protein
MTTFSFKWLMLFFIALSAGVSLAACSDDDDIDNIDDRTIYGTWVSTAVYNENDANEYVETVTVNFKLDGTGYRKTEDTYVTGAVTSDMYTFHFETTTDGTKTVRITNDENDNLQDWSYIREGNTLQIVMINGEHYIFAKAYDDTIYGTWVSTAVYNENDANEYVETVTYNFKSDGTGYRKFEYKYVTGEVSSKEYTFHFKVTTATNGERILRFTDDEDGYQATLNLRSDGELLLIGKRIYTKA